MLNCDFNLRRLERYLSVGWDSGAVPVVVLTKSDLCEDLDRCVHEAEEAAVGVDVLVVSAMYEDGYEQIMRYMKEGRTAALIGSSGVGKSTLINCMTGEDRLETNGLRNDDKGKHTTTRRELILLPDGSMVIDTPGMRELGLESTNLTKTFADIEEFASMCKFHNCTHTSEPGCAVLEEISDEKLSAERLSSYHKLKRESKYEGLDFRQIEALKIKEMFGSISSMKNFRTEIKEKNKNRYRF